MTTLTTFLTRLTGLTVSGVTRVFDEPPKKAPGTADLPAMFPQLPEADNDILTFQQNGGVPTLRAQLAIAIEPVAQSTQAANWTAMVTAFDALNSALAGTKPGTLTEGPARWTIKQDILSLGGTDYWGVVATIEGKG